MYFAKIFVIATVILTIFVGLFTVCPIQNLGDILTHFTFNFEEFFTQILTYFFYFVPAEIFNIYLTCFIFWSGLKLSITIFNKSKNLIFTAK